MLKVWQIFYDDKSGGQLDPAFIPYDNTWKLSEFFENTVILDVWKNKKKEWRGADYVGVLSWRLFEKTRLTSEKIESRLGNKEIYLLTPPEFIGSQNYLAIKQVAAVARLMDDANLFPFKLSECANQKSQSACNYFLATPGIFDEYCYDYLSKAVEWLKANNRHPQISNSCLWRGRQYPIHTFVLESLFQCYYQYNNIPPEFIFDTDLKERVDKEREESQKLVEVILN